MMTAFETDLLSHLLTFLTPQRRQWFAEVLSDRTRHAAVVLEDVFRSHNISAVLRSCDAFGIQDVHVVESHNGYEPVNEIALGSEQWLSVHRHEDTTTCLRTLRDAGYRIVATSPVRDSTRVEEVEIAEPLAIWFGTEKDGLTARVRESADELVTIPIYGFVESFNVSVATALCLQNLTRRLHGSNLNWRLPDDERLPLMLEWCRRSIPHVPMIEQRF